MRTSRLVLFLFAGLAVNALAQPPVRDARARDTPSAAAGNAIIRGRVLVAGALRQGLS